MQTRQSISTAREANFVGTKDRHALVRASSPIQSRAGPEAPSTASTAGQASSRDHVHLACLCTRFILHLFACPEYHPMKGQPGPKLPYFIARVIRRLNLPPSIVFIAMILLQRLRIRFPAARNPSGHRMFICALMIASKTTCDDALSNRSWVAVAQGLFALWEINQAERELCGYLRWDLTVDVDFLGAFEDAVRADFDRNQKTHPHYLEFKAKFKHSSTFQPKPWGTGPVIKQTTRIKEIATSAGVQNAQEPKSFDGVSSRPNASLALRNVPVRLIPSTSSHTDIAKPRPEKHVAPISDELTRLDTSPVVRLVEGKTFALVLPSEW